MATSSPVSLASPVLWPFPSLENIRRRFTRSLKTFLDHPPQSSCGVGWSPYCHAHCLHHSPASESKSSESSKCSESPELPNQSKSPRMDRIVRYLDIVSAELQKDPSHPKTSRTDRITRNLDTVPMEFHDLKEIFSKQRATLLPPHRPYNCVIKLVTGSMVLKGWLFSLSWPETESMISYIQASLANGIIHSFSSPAGVGIPHGEEGLLPPSLHWLPKT